eukprot:XP_001706045.1 Hypothetical protein GL50803_21983 [Giardia lamblia ATCC 50803]
MEQIAIILAYLHDPDKVDASRDGRLSSCGLRALKDVLHNGSAILGTKHTWPPRPTSGARPALRQTSSLRCYCL